MDYGRIYGYGWESMPPPPKKPFYLIQAEDRFEQAEKEWLALTDIEPVPYEQADAALKRLQKAEVDLAAARERDYGERMTNAFIVEAKTRQLRVEWTFNATREMVATENH